MNAANVSRRKKRKRGSTYDIEDGLQEDGETVEEENDHDEDQRVPSGVRLEGSDVGQAQSVDSLRLHSGVESDVSPTDGSPGDQTTGSSPVIVLQSVSKQSDDGERKRKTYMLAK